jgi:hypothetical protein
MRVVNMKKKIFNFRWTLVVISEIKKAWVGVIKRAGAGVIKRAGAGVIKKVACREKYT